MSKSVSVDTPTPTTSHENTPSIVKTQNSHSGSTLKSVKTTKSRAQPRDVTLFQPQQPTENVKYSKKKLLSYKTKIKIVVIVEPILILLLFAFWIYLISTGSTFSTKTDFPETDPDPRFEEFRTLEQISDNHRVTSYKKNRKLQLHFYMFTLVISWGCLVANLLVAFDSKNNMAACLLWLYTHGIWMVICICQMIRGIANRVSMTSMSPEVQDHPMWTNTRMELIFVMIYYAFFFTVDLAFARIVRLRFLYLRKEAKTRQHNAGKKILQKLKHKKAIRLRQKELYYERELRGKTEDEGVPEVGYKEPQITQENEL